MSSKVRIGAVLQQLQEIDTSPSVKRNETGDVVTRKYNLNKGRVKDVTDALVYGTADGEYSNAVLTEIASEPINANSAEITLVYAPVNATDEVLPPVGTVIQETDANAIDIPIGKATISDSQKDQNLKDGVEAFLSPQPIYRRIEILDAFVFSESNAIDDVGKIDNSPEDLTTPALGKWLKVGFVVRTVGSKFEQTETWQYAENGWDTAIYTAIA
jgi:hypothetical protein